MKTLHHTTADKANLVQTHINIDTFLFPIAYIIIRKIGYLVILSDISKWSILPLFKF